MFKHTFKYQFKLKLIPVGNKLTSFHLGLSLCNSISHCASQIVIYSYLLLHYMSYFKLMLSLGGIQKNK